MPLVDRSSNATVLFVAVQSLVEVLSEVADEVGTSDGSRRFITSNVSAVVVVVAVDGGGTRTNRDG